MIVPTVRRSVTGVFLALTLSVLVVLLAPSAAFAEDRPPEQTTPSGDFDAACLEDCRACGDEEAVCLRRCRLPAASPRTAGINGACLSRCRAKRGEELACQQKCAER